ncbi:MAG: hypothetical protein HWE08_07235 [Alphaproteobacteria bacterium]|nr:hypothetical protein [Alphaproteobacteria bacterium]
MAKREEITEVMGWRIAPPRITRGAVLAALKYIALPITLGLTLLDVMFYLFFQHVLERCYGILCLLT